MLRSTGMRAAAALAGTVLLAACETEDLSRQITGPGGEADVFAAPLGSPAGLPSGTFFVASPFDLWNRSTGLLGFFNTGNFFNFAAWDFEDKLRNASNDPRLPVLASTTAAWDRFAVMGTQSFSGVPNSYDLFAEMTGLLPNTEYTIMLVRYGMIVNGNVDAENILRGRPADAPDSLFVLGGTPAGTPDYPCDFSEATAPTVTATANPFVLGTVTSDASGELTWDCVIHAGGIWDANNNTILGGQPAIPFGGNHIQTFDLPAYNYVVIVQGRGTPAAPVPTGPSVARAQMGVDLNASGDPVRNALAPFPLEAAGPATTNELRFRNPSALGAGKTYKVWAVNSETGVASPVVGDLRRFEPSGAIQQEEMLGVSEFSGGGGRDDLYVLTVNTTTSDVEFTDNDELRVTIGDAGAAAPSDTVFLAAEYLDAPGNTAGLPASGNLKFGEEGYTFGGSGTAFFFGDELRVNLANLPAPPLGYFYEVFLVDAGTAESLSLGPITTPAPEYASLRDADLSMVSTELIANATLLVNQTALAQPFAAFTDVYVTLSPKVRAGLPLTVALQAVIPAEVVAGGAAAARFTP